MAGPADRHAVPVALGALVPPEDIRLLERLWGERPELATRWLAEIDREEAVHRAHTLMEAMASDPARGPEVGEDGHRADQNGTEELSS